MERGDVEEGPSWDCLRKAQLCVEPSARLRYALEGLRASEREGDWKKEEEAESIRALLFRQASQASLLLGREEEALAFALSFCGQGTLTDVAHAERATILRLLARPEEAIEAQQQAVLHAPSSRASFHLWCLAQLQQSCALWKDAHASLDRAKQAEGADLLLLSAQRCLLRFRHEGHDPRAPELLGRLRDAGRPLGYAEYLYGLIACTSGRMQRVKGPSAVSSKDSKGQSR